jgi:hypothetical protein
MEDLKMKNEIKDKKLNVEQEVMDEPKKKTTGKKAAAAPEVPAEDVHTESTPAPVAIEKKKRGSIFGSVEIETIDEYEEQNHRVRPKRFNRSDRKYVATIEGEDKYKKKMSEETTRLAALIQSQKTGTILTETVIGDEPVANRGDMRLLVCRYGPFKVIIPDNMFLELPPEKDEEKRNILSRRTGSTVDFVVRQIDTEKKVALASRLDAMLIKRKRYWFGINKGTGGVDEYHFREGMKMEARIVSTAKTCIHVEVFGVETRIMVQDLSYQRIPDAQKEFNIGEKVVVRIMKIERNPKTFEVTVEASVKAAQEDPRIRAMDLYVKGGEYEGLVTMLDTTKGSGVFVRLDCIDVACGWLKDIPVAIGDKVKILITKVDEEKLQISGVLRHVVKRAI